MAIASPSTTALAVVGIVIAFVAVKIIHRVYFHPLAKYPGPFLAKITDLYAAYHGWRGDIHLDMWRCHEKYGDYVRYKPNALLFNTASGLKEIHGTGSATKLIKADSYTPMIHRAPNTLTIRGGKEHARRRRIMAQGVSEKALRGYESRVMRHVDKFCNAAFEGSAGLGQGDGEKKGWSRPMDMSKWFNYLAFDVMADVVFGAQYDLLGQERFRYVVDCIVRSNQRMSALIQAPWLTWAKLDKYIFRDAIKARNRFVKFVMRVVKERQDKAGSSTTDMKSTSSFTSISVDSDAGPKADIIEDHDVFANLEAAKDPETGEGFRADEIAAESATLIVAGSDTSSAAMAATMFYLAHNVAAYARAAAEVRSAFSSRDQIRMGAQLASCVYLRACIDEAMRISPPVGSSLWREVAAPEGVIIDRQAVPVGMDVGVGIYSIHHSPRYYADPFIYRPERWLEDDGAGDSVERARSVFNPFSNGTRGCLGKALAQTEMMLALSSVLFVGDFKPADGEQGKTGCGRRAPSTGATGLPSINSGITLPPRRTGHSFSSVRAKSEGRKFTGAGVITGNCGTPSVQYTTAKPCFCKI